MRAHVMLAVVISVAATTAAAEPDRHLDAELVRPELKRLTATTFDLRGSKRKEIARWVHTYDKAGQVVSVEYRQDGKVTLRMSYTWSNGRISKRVAREAGGRVETRSFTYKLDAQQRVVESTMRDPKAHNGERYVTTTSWKSDGSRDEYTSRHYTTEGPYRDGSASYDAAGRLDSTCSSSSCSFFERDKHGNVRRVRDQFGEDHAYRTIDLTYDANGQLVSTKQGSGERTYRYDSHGDLIEDLRAGESVTVVVYARR